MPSQWTSYDSSAGCHQSVMGPKIFARPAADMVALLDVLQARTILDVGTGSGVAALAALEAAPDAAVTGIDPSLTMILTARGRGLVRIAVASLPDLPFANASFDRVMANFVLSHVPSYEASLAEMVRVLSPGGRLAMTAWGAISDEYHELWESLAAARLGKERMEEVRLSTIPWEDWLADAQHVQHALGVAGLSRVTVDHREYEVRMTVAEFLSTREASHIARYMRHALGAEEWTRFWSGVGEEFHRRYAGSVTFTRDVQIGSGVGP